MCVQIPHFSVVEILVKHCSLYNKLFYSQNVQKIKLKVFFFLSPALDNHILIKRQGC